MSSSTQEFVDRARAAAEGTPYAVAERPYGFDLTIDLADARWLTITRAHGLKRVFTHEVHLRDDGRYGITDVDNTVSYSGGTASLSAERSFKRGRVMSYSRRVEFGVDAGTGRVGKVVDYSFRAGEGRDLIRGVAKELGWAERMNAEQRGALVVGIATIVLTVGAFAAIGIHALLS
ncbi:hypothetical protein ASH01_09025 [Terrabacter sp. Soil811]|uniref:hypothetical protein n=1 Tax=Terrabacter sp. Soil811 TaxID=1736419 RepID=UPI0007015808|nr:hypothetical protein [Terrabacter sp. Soil811]KRF45911.1 hypothetical protein ASH01_09025 [Terrabacter sp. Soil811]